MDVIYKRAIIGGVVSTAVMATGTFLLGEISGNKAMDLLSTSLSGINMLCNTVILASSTILALMLNLLNISRSANSRLTNKHYKNVLHIAKYDTILIIVSVITFLMLNLRIAESSEVPKTWYDIIYFTSLGMAAVLGGGLIAIVTMLYGTIASIILIVGLKVTDHPLVDHDEAEESKKEQEEQDKPDENNKHKEKAKEKEQKDKREAKKNA